MFEAKEINCNRDFNRETSFLLLTNIMFMEQIPTLYIINLFSGYRHILHLKDK